MTLEDFTTYIEVDGDGDITVAANLITIDTMLRNPVSYVRDDKTADHFGDFEHLNHIKCTLKTASSGFLCWAVSNGSNTLTQMNTNTDGMCLYFYNSGGNVLSIYLRDCETPSEDGFTAAINTDYYLTIDRTNTTLTCKIYSDASRTNLLDTLSTSCETTLFQYVFGCASLEYSLLVDKHMSGTIADLNLQEVIPPEFLFDSISISDNILFKHDFNLSDTVNIDDGISTVIKYLVELFDSVDIDDVITFKYMINLIASMNINDNIIYKHLINLADSIGIDDDGVILKRLVALLDNIDINDITLFKHFINLADTIDISDSLSLGGIVILLDNISILDDIDIQIADTCGTIFQLQGDSYTVFLPIPEYAGEEGKLNNELTLFDFWSERRNLVTIGINTEPLVLGGIIFACTDSEETEMVVIAEKFLNINEMMDNNEEIRISGLNNCVDAIYVIKNFKYGTIARSPYAYAWQLTLEYVRAS